MLPAGCEVGGCPPGSARRAGRGRGSDGSLPPSWLWGRLAILSHPGPPNIRAAADPPCGTPHPQDSQDVADDPDAPHVRGVANGLIVDHFGCHELRGAEEDLQRPCVLCNQRERDHWPEHGGASPSFSNALICVPGRDTERAGLSCLLSPGRRHRDPGHPLNKGITAPGNLPAAPSPQCLQPVGGEGRGGEAAKPRPPGLCPVSASPTSA